MCFSLSESNSYYMATMNYPRIALMLKMGLRRVLRKTQTFRINGTFCLK